MSEENEPTVAYEVTVDDTICVTFAPSARKAKMNAVLAARDAGYYAGKGWPNKLRAARREHLDKSPLNTGSGRRCYDPEYVDGCWLVP